MTIASNGHRGASAARNHALLLAHGDYIQWLDADDILASDKIEKQLRHVESGLGWQTLLSSAWSRFYYRLNNAKPARNCLWTSLSPVEWMIRKLGENGWMAIETWLISRQLTEKAGPWNTSLSLDDDGEYISRLVCAADGVRFEPRSMSYVRQANLASLSRGNGPEKQESQFRSMKLQIGNLRALDDSEEVRKACVKYLQRWLPSFHPEQPLIVDEARQLAGQLGGELLPPKPRPKYLLIEKVLGWNNTKKLAQFLSQMRALLIKQTDWLLFRMSIPRKDQF